MCKGGLFQIFLGCGLLYLWTGNTGTHAESILQLDPQRIVVRYKDPLSVNCITNVTNLGLNWETPQGEINTTDDRKMTVWTVKSLTEWTIKPYCFINVDYENISSEELKITIYKIPDSVSISTVAHSGPMIEGRQYELQCKIQNVAPVQFLTVNWYKGDTLLGNKTFNNSIKTPENLTVTFQISPSREDDGAQYSCETQLNLGPEGPQTPPTMKSHPINFTVHYKPEIFCPDHIIFKEREEFNPNCTINGHPSPVVSWLKDGEIVDILQNMDWTDAGQYTLIASNGFNATHTVEVEVLYAPFSISELENISVDQCNNVYLKCSSFANPRPLYTWKFPAQVHNVRTIDEDGVSLLLIDYPTGQNTGTYTCIASNDLGNTSKSIIVSVKETPDTVAISAVNHNGPMIDGRQYELQCNIKYFAPVQLISVIWYKGENQVKKVNFSDPSGTDMKQILTTLPVSLNKNDNGIQYSCEAKVQTMQGIQQLLPKASLNVTVHYKPVINTTKLPDVVPVFRGYPEVLVCEADGYPQPTITWTYKLQTINGGNLTINDASSENAGIYHCTANNSVNSTVRVVKVVLKEDYLPLIAGFVALVVVITSIIFVIIYSIYYKNTKMGRYMVEGAKPKAQNGNIAQNGKDSTIPMKKLSQNSLFV